MCTYLCRFLALSSNITGLILSALKLTFIIQIDENLYKMLSACKWIKSKNEFKLSKLEYFVPSLFANCETMMKSSRKEGKEEDAEYSCSLFSLFICFEGFLQLFINLAFAFVISVGYITWVQDHVGCSRCPGDVVPSRVHTYTHARTYLTLHHHHGPTVHYI